MCNMPCYFLFSFILLPEANEMLAIGGPPFVKYWTKLSPKRKDESQLRVCNFKS